MQKIVVALIYISIFVVRPGGAAEVDSVTPRNLHLDNSLPVLNAIFEQRIQEGIDKANAKRGGSCSEEALYTELRKAIFQSLTASWGLKGYDLDKQLRRLLARQSYSLSLNDSIYRDIDYLEGFSLNLKELSDLVNINGHLVGLDKVGHFFAQGWQYFEQPTIDQALEWGRGQETGLFGYTTTGIFSFADLVANFNGWRFWNKVLLQERDPLKGVIANFLNRPYVSCKIQFVASLKEKKLVKAWEYNSRLDLADYVDGAWDEGNNCNSYEDPVIEEKVRSRVTAVDPEFSCPCQAEECLAAQKKYGPYAKYILHPSCLTVSKE